jgi:hypothetical protein
MNAEDKRTDALPEGHPLPWDELVPYEQQQGGYWLYPQGCDVYGNGRVWVRVPRPEQPGEMTGFKNRLSLLLQDVETRAKDTGSAEMAALAGELKRVRASQPG